MISNTTEREISKIVNVIDSSKQMIMFIYQIIVRKKGGGIMLFLYELYLRVTK